MIRFAFWTFIAALVLAWAPLVVVAVALAYVITHRHDIFH